jgi:hypothetical protein
MCLAEYNKHWGNCALISIPALYFADDVYKDVSEEFFKFLE